MLAAGGIGAAVLLSAASDVRDFEEGLVRLQQDSRGTGAEMAVLRDKIRQASKETGVNSEKILEGAKTYIALTGDLKGATQQTSLFARAAQASNSAVEDIASTTASLAQSMGIKPEGMEAALSSLIVMGEKGSVALKDFAAYLPQLAPMMAKFKGGASAEGLRDLGAAVQVINNNFKDASQTATSFKALVASFERNADKFAAGGVQIFEMGPDGTKRMRSFRDILKDIDKSTLVKDPQLMLKALGSTEAAAALTALRQYSAEFDGISESGKDAGAVARNLDVYLTSSAGRMATSMNRVKEAIAASFTPDRIELFASALEKVADAIERISDLAKTVGSAGGTTDWVARVDRLRAKGFDFDTARDIAGGHIGLPGRKFEDIAQMTPGEFRQAQADQKRLDVIGGARVAQFFHEAMAGGQMDPASTQRNQDALNQARMTQLLLTGQSPSSTLGGSEGAGILRFLPSLQKAVADGIKQGLASAPPAVTKIGGDTIRAASNSAPSVRRRPGG